MFELVMGAVIGSLLTTAIWAWTFRGLITGRERIVKGPEEPEGR